MKKPLVFAHRGANRLAPENTMAAFTKAYELGATALEFDVQLSRDYHPIIIHDDTLARTTNGHGLVAEHSYEQLHALSAGAWFREDFADERIPTLEATLKAFIPKGLYLNIEIKPNQLDKTILVDKVLTTLTETNTPLNQILLSSFDQSIIKILATQKNHPKAKYALLLDKTHERPVASARSAQRDGCASINPHLSILEKEGVAFIRAAHHCGLRVLCFTINNAETAEYFLSQGLDGFFTDNELLY